MLGLVSLFWDENDRLPSDVSHIGLISYAAVPGNYFLTNGSRKTARLSLELMEIYPTAKLMWGVYSENEESAQLETREKRRVFDSCFPGRHIFVGRVRSTTAECEAILKAAPDATSFLVVSEGWHSRRDRIVWKHFFKGDLFFQSIPGDKCADTRNPILMQRFSLIWMLFNMFFTPPYKYWPGVEWFARRSFRQPSL